MAYPGSLVDFMRQGELVKEYGKSYATLKQVMKSISEREKTDDPNIENKIRAKEESCKKTNQIRLDEYLGTYTSELCPDFHEAFRE